MKLGRAHAEAGKWAPARDAFRQATRVDPEDVDAYRALAAACAKLGEHEDAVLAYKAVLGRQRDDVEALGGLGRELRGARARRRRD